MNIWISFNQITICEFARIISSHIYIYIYIYMIILRIIIMTVGACRFSYRARNTVRLFCFKSSFIFPLWIYSLWLDHLSASTHTARPHNLLCTLILPNHSSLKYSARSREQNRYYLHLRFGVSIICDLTSLSCTSSHIVFRSVQQL